MKNFIHYSIMIVALGLLLTSCKQKSEENVIVVPTSYTYAVAIEPVDADYLSPALQSFVHAKIDEDWILFAGRTNGEDPIGGLHNLSADYSLASFPPKSFNSTIYTFNPVTGKKNHLDYWEMMAKITDMSIGSNGESEEIQKICSMLAEKLEKHGSIFISSNPQVKQSGDYLYVVGGYGPPLGEEATTSNYQTFDAMARINVPLLMKIVNKEWNLSAAEWKELFLFGNSPTLRATGGELKKLGDQFYLAGGHNFNNNEQVYLNAVYQFDFIEDLKTLTLDVKVTDTISDISAIELAHNPKKADSTSVFRRRDLPIVPSVYLDKDKNLAPNFALMGGVFKYHFAAWNDAIYITPNGEEKYFIDSKHDQKDSNIYSCPDFVIYDALSTDIHTFLPGGIGNGRADDNLSGFTNTMGYSKYNLKTLESSFDTISNAFPSKYFYGAEAEFMPNSKAKYLNVNGLETDVIDGDNTFKKESTVQIGYIYGGIESYEDSPSTFGKGKSGASNKVWKVMVTRTPVIEEK